jgi:predicted GNAT superfamily acetyltransferase
MPSTATKSPNSLRSPRAEITDTSARYASVVGVANAGSTPVPEPIARVATVRAVSSPVIRPVVDDDVDVVLAINEANVPEVGSIDLDRLRWLVERSIVALAVEVDSEVAGFTIVLPSGTAYDSVNYRWFAERFDRFAYLDRVAFTEAFRGRGLGRALYDDVDRRLVELGHDRLALEVNVEPPNEPSLAFHRRLGFAEVGRQDTPYGIRVSMQLRAVGGAD